MHTIHQQADIMYQTSTVHSSQAMHPSIY